MLSRFILAALVACPVLAGNGEADLTFFGKRDQGGVFQFNRTLFQELQAGPSVTFKFVKAGKKFEDVEDLKFVLYGTYRFFLGYDPGAVKDGKAQPKQYREMASLDFLKDKLVLGSVWTGQVLVEAEAKGAVKAVATTSLIHEIYEKLEGDTSFGPWPEKRIAALKEDLPLMGALDLDITGIMKRVPESAKADLLSRYESGKTAYKEVKALVIRVNLSQAERLWDPAKKESKAK